MRVLFVTPFDPGNPDAWAGTQASMLRTLRTRCEVSVLHVRPPLWMRVARRLLSRFFPHAATRDFGRSQLSLRSQARTITKALRRSPVDLIFSPSSVPLSAYKGDVPSLFWTDAVYPQLVGFYDGEFARVAPSTLARSTEQEIAALRNSRSVYSSDWAAGAASELCPGASPLVLGFGPNLQAESIERVRMARVGRVPSDALTFLWIGGEWERKGGPRAFDLVRLLAERGIEARLHVVGATPPQEDVRVRAHGRLSKSDAGDLTRLEDLFAQADFMLLPSLADCTPIVVSEAAAVGLPVIATDVGGLGETVRRFGMGLVHTSDADFAKNVASDLEVAMATPHLRSGWEASARRAAEWLSWDASFRKILSIGDEASRGSDLLPRRDIR